MGLSNALVLPGVSLPRQLAPCPALGAARQWMLPGKKPRSLASRGWHIAGYKGGQSVGAQSSPSRLEPQLLGAGGSPGL